LEYDPTIFEDGGASLSHGVSLSLPFLGHSLKHTFPYGQSLNDGPVLLDAFTAEEYLEEASSEEVSDFDDATNQPYVVVGPGEDFYIQENSYSELPQPASQVLFHDTVNLQEYSEEYYSFVLNNIPECLENNNWLDALLFDSSVVSPAITPTDNLLDFYVF
jgi:hypothetical protein